MKRGVLLAICFLAAVAAATEVRAACTFTLTPASAAVPATAGTGTFTVNASSASCKWRASVTGGFMSANPKSGTGSLSITFRYTQNTAVAPRSGTISVQGVAFTLTQAGAAPQNEAPTANAGAAQTVAGGSTVTLDGSGTDAEGAPLTYAWTQTGGQAVALSNSTTATPAFVAPAATSLAQTLTFQLVVHDGTQNSAPSSTTVTVAAKANVAPAANAGAAQTVTGNSTVTLNGSGTDPEGATLTYAWTQTGGPAVTLSNPATAKPQFVAPPATSLSQTLTFQLVVHDGTQNSAPASTTVTVSPKAAPAFASADIGAVGVAGSTAVANGAFTVKGAGADIWGATDSFRFVYQPLTGDGSIVARLVSMENTHAYAKAGIMLRDALTAGSAHAMLDMKPNGELEFMARATAGGATAWYAGVTMGAPVYVKLSRAGSKVSASVSRDGINWTIVSSISRTLPSTLYAGLVVCSHDATRLNTAMFDGVVVAAGPGADLAPTADSGEAQTVAGGSFVRLYGSGTDPEGEPLTYAWTQASGPSVALSSATVASPTFVAPAATAATQDLVFNLVVSDGALKSAPSAVTVSVAPASSLPQSSGSLLPSRPSGGATINVPAGGDLQAAITSAMPGDVIVLQAGATYTGNYRLKAKGGRAYVMIRSSATFAEGARVGPATAGLARIVSPTIEPAMQTEPGASFYWLEGLELLTAGGTNEILRLGDGSSAQNSLSLVPHDLVVSHCYIHGKAGVEQKRGIALNSGLTYIADSHIDEIKGAGYDTQAIGGWNGPGPYRIYNNYLSAAGEIVMFGGDDPKIVNLVPTDIIFKGNYLTRPTSWRGTAWTVKNIFELKNAQQVVIEGNTFENHWQAAQPGPAIVFTPRNQGGTAPWTVVRDVRFQNNRVRHVAAVFNILGQDNVNPSQLTRNIVIANNVFEDVSAANWGGTGRFLLITGGDNIQFDHNTVFQDGSSVVYAYGPQTTGFTFTSTIVPHNGYGIFGDSTSPGMGAITKYFPGGLVTGNLLVGATITYPAGNYYPATMSDVCFVSLAGGDYRLSTSSPYKLLAADGRDPGADVTAIR